MSDMEKDFTEQELEQEAMAAAAEEPAKEEKPAKSKAAKTTDKKPAKKKKGNRVSRWFKELRAELKKVTWPTKKQTVNNTMVVIVMCLIVGVFIWAFDWIAANLILALLNLRA